MWGALAERINYSCRYQFQIVFELIWTTCLRRIDDAEINEAASITTRRKIKTLTGHFGQRAKNRVTLETTHVNARHCFAIQNPGIEIEFVKFSFMKSGGQLNNIHIDFSFSDFTRFTKFKLKI